MHNLIDSFLLSAQTYPHRPAIRVDHTSYDYQFVLSMTQKIAAQLPSSETLIGLYGGRNLPTYIHVLAISYSGAGYVPLNPLFPDERTASIIRQSGLRTILTYRAVYHGILKICREHQLDVQLLCYEELCEQPSFLSAPRRVEESNIAYLLFTSGTTGQPKGVPISHKNVCHFLTTIQRLYQFTPEDRFSQMFDLTFDLSVFDIFASLGCGACLCIPSAQSVKLPTHFIRQEQLTVWFSVPSVVSMMKSLRLIKSDIFPSLRISLFCGEALSLNNALLWGSAASQSVVDNLYGPTEATIACSVHRISPSTEQNAPHGIVPIGTPLQDTCFFILDDQLRPVEDGSPGELFLGGPQVTSGYWNNPNETRAKFHLLPSLSSEPLYATGDMVKQLPNGELLYLNRKDHQVQIRGYRVELGEIEHSAQDIDPHCYPVAVPLLQAETETMELVLCIAHAQASKQQFLTHMEKSLPSYMIPSEIYFLDQIPLNNNNKVDRNQLSIVIQKLI